MKSVVVIGSGISGIVTSYLLDKKYNVTLVESNSYLGGHTHTVKVNDPVSGNLLIDTGFIVFNLKNYPLFTRFIRELNVEYQDSDMSFGFYDISSSFWYNSDFPNGTFSQKKNVVSLRFWKFLMEIKAFNVRVLNDLEKGVLEFVSLGDYVATLPFSDFFIESYVLPMGAAIWSCPTSQLLNFPASSFFSFWKNHSLLTLDNRPIWKTIKGGSYSYIEAFLKVFKGTILKGSPVKKVIRKENSLDIILSDNRHLSSDYVVIATHADQALTLLDKPTSLETELLGVWNYSKNKVFLHTDNRVMPPKKNAWASWVVSKSATLDQSIYVTYYMNRLQKLSSTNDYFVTLNQDSYISSEKCLQSISYTHPIFDKQSMSTQGALSQLNTSPLFFCGSYFGHGFHEDGVQSAVNICLQLGVDL